MNPQSTIFCKGGALFFLLLLPFRSHALEPSQQPRLLPVIDTLVQQYGLDQARVESILKQATFDQRVLDAMSKPAEKALRWHQYRPIFVTDDRALMGVRFWKQHQATIDRIARKYGVPPEILVAILGVETRYGSFRGRYRVLDSLATLAVSDYRRNDFFRDELIHFLRLAEAERLDPLALTGSYAGAMGIPQFIASSYLRYAVDEDGDHSRNLWDSVPDVVASVANYLKSHGWQEGQPITGRILPGAPMGEQELEALTRPEQSLSGFLAQPASWIKRAPAGVRPDQKVSLLSLQASAQVEYYLVFENFYAITRYNHSPLYAMAVYQLAEKIASAMALP